MRTRLLQRFPARAAGAALLLLAALAVAGCRPKTSATVSGKVTYNGKAVTSGNVIFVGARGKPSLPAPIQPDGTYTATGVPLGEVKVAVDNPPPANVGQGEVPKSLAHDPEVQANRVAAAHYVPTPARYRNPDQSGLGLEVKGGSNTYDIVLK